MCLTSLSIHSCVQSQVPLLSLAQNMLFASADTLLFANVLDLPASSTARMAIQINNNG